MNTKNKIPADSLRAAIIYFIKERRISIPVVLDNVDISRSRLYDYLQGNGKISATTMANILTATGVSFNEILTHIYIDNPMLVSMATQNIQLSTETNSSGKPTIADVDMTIRKFRSSNDINLLSELITTINYRVADVEERDQLIARIMPTVDQLFRKQKFFSNADTLLFSSLLPYEDYEKARQVADVTHQYVLELNKLERQGLMSARRGLPDAYHNYGLITIELLKLAMANDDSLEVHRLIKQIGNFEMLIADFYFSTLRKIANVMALILDNDFIDAERTWNTLVETIDFMIDPKLAGTYYYFTKMTFAEFSKPITEYLDRL
ncbi:hypothetical protein ESZ50_07660 [Weissella muntiaci]|uniref:HTH cro/C1-type domain-containing protein n=1 Tax=Weissella muntiaci TaxID=2508881 RepID=A0A6C2C5C2_9LACO|nr:hypothetical protein [Weissella muntiaci]TYC49114.1 hypothetical protein ESZ50_07660 [Weissella muntiaci]